MKYMKKILTILALLTLVGCENSTNDTRRITSYESPNTGNEYEMTFKSDELGIKFKYTSSSEAKMESSLKDFNTGEAKTISTDDFSVSLTSADYSMGVSEGCCYYYTGEPVSTTMTDGETEVFISRSLGELYNFQRIKVDGREAFRFLRVTEYVEKSIVDTILIPYDHKPYTNIMISGENSGPISGLEEISSYVKNFNASNEFESFLESFEFLNGGNESSDTSEETINVEYDTFSFEWPSSWEVYEKSDGNTYNFTKTNGYAICSAYFSILKNAGTSYINEANSFKNNDGTLTVSTEGAGGSGFKNSKIIYAYGIWKDEIMYFVSIAMDSSAPCYESDFKSTISRADVESFLKTFK